MVLYQCHILRLFCCRISDAWSYSVLVWWIHVFVSWPLFICFWHFWAQNKNSENSFCGFCIICGVVHWIRYINHLHVLLFNFSFLFLIDYFLRKKAKYLFRYKDTNSLETSHKRTPKVLSIWEACFDMISGFSLSMKIQIRGENYWKSGVRIPAPEGQTILCLFSVHFQILHKKLHIFASNHFWISCFTKTKNFNMFYLISILIVKTKQDIKT